MNKLENEFLVELRRLMKKYKVYVENVESYDGEKNLEEVSYYFRSPGIKIDLDFVDEE